MKRFLVTAFLFLCLISVRADYSPRVTTNGWNAVYVTGSDFTTTGQTLVDVTGLVSSTLTNSTLYEVDATISASTSADATGIKFGIHGAGTGTAATTNVVMLGTSTSATSAAIITLPAVDTASGTFLGATSITGTVRIMGTFTTTSTGTPTLSIQALKVTSGTATIKVGSVLRWKKAGP